MKILLVDKDINYCKNLMNAISSLSNNVCISYIANSIKEISETFIVDIVLADVEFYHSELDDIFPVAPIIYLSTNASNSNQNSNIISKTNIDLIIQTIEYYSKDISDKCLEKAIVAQLAYLGFNFSLIGTKQLIEALKLLYNNSESHYSRSLEKNVYPQVARQFDLPLRTLKGNISYAINKMLDDCDKRKLYSYIGFRFSKRPGSKAVICAILEKLTINH